MKSLSPFTFHLVPRFKKGFTLIELLVVVSIIGVLASVAVANFITAQKQARDASRKQIITNIQSAFEQYYAQTGEYPSSSPDEAFENGELPVDPKNENPYVINWEVSDSQYCVCATLETGAGNASNDSCAWSDTGSYFCGINKQ
jgi:prepilin-type N-terminal cleavage/methylation domain-containing protein